MSVRLLARENAPGADPLGPENRFILAVGPATGNEFDVKPAGCPNCFLKCTKLTRVRRGRHKGLEIEGPEYETIYALGGLNEIEGLEEVAWLNDLCDRLGLDTMSAGNIAAFAAEARRRGRISFDIGPNNPDAVAELLTLTAERRGVGDLFARGIREAAGELGLMLAEYNALRSARESSKGQSTGTSS